MSLFNREKFLIVYGYPPEKWAKRFDIEPFTHACRECKRPMTTTLPFFLGQLRGLMSPPCPCGSDHQPYCVVRDPRFGDLLSMH